MSYTLNSYDLLTKYGIQAGHAPSSNVSLQGAFDMPARIGVTSHDWGDEDGIEPFSASGDIFFGGRDINLHGSIPGSNSVLNANLKTFYDDIQAVTGLNTLSTPYGDYNVIVRKVDPEYLPGGASVSIQFREPIVDLTGGTLPASGMSDNTIDESPFISFGIYLSEAKELHSLPEMKEQNYTSHGLEGYQITKRKNRVLEFSGFIIGSSLADFQSKIKALYTIFSSPGLRTIKINAEISVSCFATSGFTVDNVYIYNNGMAGMFKINLQVISVTNLIQIIPAILPTDAELLANKTFVQYGRDGALVYKLDSGSYIVDASVTPLETPIVWKNTEGLTDGPMNRCGVWSALDATPGQFIGFGEKIDIPVAKLYWIGVGCDNGCEISIDNTIIFTLPTDDTLEDHYLIWHLLPISLSAGTHLIHVRGYNDSALASIGAVIHDALITELQAMTTVGQLEAKTIFSTKDFIGLYVQEGNFGTGWTCPEGWTLVNTDGIYTCER